MNKKDIKNIKNILSSISGDPRYAGKLDEKRIEKIWRETNAPYVVDRTQKITFLDGKLIIHINSAPLKQELFNSRGMCHLRMFLSTVIYAFAPTLMKFLKKGGEITLKKVGATMQLTVNIFTIGA